MSDTEYDYPDREPRESWIYRMNEKEYTPLYITSNKKNICNRKVEQENGKYKHCNKELFTCDWCYTDMCPSLCCIPQYMIRRYGSVSHSKQHDKCTDCDRITCRISGICGKCETNHHYDMVAEHVAIGSINSPYDQFDLVINLSYPENGVKRDEITHGLENKSSSTPYVVRCGFTDDKDGLTPEKLENVLQIISEIEKEKGKTLNILIHCYAGVSRSSTVAISYLSKRDGKTVDETYNLVKQKRPRIDPNPHFRKLIGLKDI